MEIKIYMRGADYRADGIYVDGKVIVLKGALLRNYKANFKRNTKVFSMREDTNIVDGEMNLLVDCEFSSPSAAAQFIMGCSRDGYDSWKMDEMNKSYSLGIFLEEKGIRERKRRK